MLKTQTQKYVPKIMFYIRSKTLETAEYELVYTTVTKEFI